MKAKLKEYGHTGHEAWWEHFKRDDDTGIRGSGATLEEAFERIGVALTSVVTDVSTVDETEGPIEIECQSPDYEMMLADWINALLLEMGERSMLFRRFEVKIKDRRLRAKVWGEPVDTNKHIAAAEVKGTADETLYVGQEPDGTWVAECILDLETKKSRRN